MRKHLFLLVVVVVLFLAGQALSAEDFQLIYSNGEVSVKTQSGWSGLMSGDSLAADTTVRLGPGAVAEFSSPGTTLLFSKPGSYRLQAAASQKPQDESRVISSVFGRIAKMGSAASRSQSQAMGVRGDVADGNPSITWIEEDSMSFDEARAAYDSGEFTLAIDILENEVEPIVLSDESEYWYYLSASYLGSGQKGPALQIAQQHSANQFSTVYPEFLLLKGRLQLEARDYSLAAEHLKNYIYQVNTDSRKQLGYYLYAIALQQLGQQDNARQALQMVLQLDADSELTQLARRQLN
ncbi:MAG: hypothetical protein U5P10_17715 [Spirochaetia bacterium]|nr:hypothetical protein [Spirochaetia bacterium]